MEKKTKILVGIVILAVIGFVSYGYIFGLSFEILGISFEGEESDFYLPAAAGDNVSTYKNSCSELNMYQVSKDPGSLNGQKIMVTGQILKKDEFVQFSKMRTYIVLKVSGLSPDLYVLVSYSTTTPFNQGDNLTVYGEYYYPAQADSPQEVVNKNLPGIKAVHLEKV